MGIKQMKINTEIPYLIHIKIPIMVMGLVKIDDPDSSPS